MDEDHEDLEPKYTWPNNGRPPLFANPDDMQAAITDYFQRGVTKKQVVIGSGDRAKVIEVLVPTITGLVLFLGFDSRQSFYDYEKKQEFSYTIKRARAFIEREYEEYLNNGGGAAAIFALKNFGWKDERQVALSDGTLETASKIKGFTEEDDELEPEDNLHDDGAESAAEVAE